MAEYERTLIHEWVFHDSTKSDEEKLADTVGDVTATIGYNAFLQDDGLYLSYGDSDYMKAYALMADVVKVDRDIEVDVLSFTGAWDSGMNGRFIMFDNDDTGAFDEGLIYNDSLERWCFCDAVSGYDSGFEDLEKTAFSGKTVRIRITSDRTISLYVDDELIGSSSNQYLYKNYNLGLGASWGAATGTTITAVRIYEISEIPYYTVRFLNREGTDVLSSQSIKSGESATAPVPPTEDGYFFIGWSTSYKNITADTTIYARYRVIPPHPALHFYEKQADNTYGDFITSYKGVNSCTITKKLDGECSVEVKLLTRQTEGVVSVNTLMEIDGLVFNIINVKKTISGGMCYSEFSGEHISYILNNDEYLVEAFDMTGSPSEILAVLLEDTPFIVGTVDFTDDVTLRVNQNATRRACVMQLLALVKGEIEYYGFVIGIRSHVGKSTVTDIMKSANVKDVSYSYDATEQRYSFSIDLYRKGTIELGDEVQMSFKQLGINHQRRVVGMEWNPFNYNEVSITIGAYVPTLNDSLYSLISEVSDIRESTAKYTVEFGEIIGNGTFYFTRAYADRPYFHVHTDDGSTPTITLNKRDGSAFGAYVGATLSDAKSTTTSLVVFYCTVPDETEDEDEE